MSAAIGQPCEHRRELVSTVDQLDREWTSLDINALEVHVVQDTPLVWVGLGFDSLLGLVGVVAQRKSAVKRMDGSRRQSLRMHRDRACGVEDPGTGNLKELRACGFRNSLDSRSP